MPPGLHPFGTDFGNGPADQVFFQTDDRSPRWLSEKQRVLHQHPGRDAHADETEAELCALHTAREWFATTLASERGVACSAQDLGALGRQVAEDFVVLHRPHKNADRAVWVHVCFPSGWRPERILGRSFLEIHSSIPEFEGIARGASGLVDAMVERGPYVRFVWTIAADDHLDHHPEQGQRVPWSDLTREGFLRVERQVTVPLPAANASVFLIRTHLYRFEELTSLARATLAGALELMPAALLRYKGLERALPHALRLLAS